MPFMRRQITSKVRRWLKVETMDGTTEFVSVLDTGLDIPNGNNFDSPDIAETIRQYTESEPESWENIQGVGARLSAPGYLDCTEWVVFDSEEKAIAYLDEYYPEDEEDSEAS